MIISVEILPAAWGGLLKIKHHVTDMFGEKTAEEVTEGILSSLEWLQEFPDSGEEERTDGIRHRSDNTRYEA